VCAKVPSEEITVQIVVASLVIVGALGLLNLLLTIGVLRRMRSAAAPSSAWEASGLRPGAAIGEFEAVTIDGEPITDQTVDGTVAFFSAGCTACNDILPDFVTYARMQGRDNVVAVVNGDDPQTVELLAEVARVVTADLDGGTVAAAFHNVATPAFYVVAHQHVLAAPIRVADLPVRPAASRS
jgi:hypothetical protein